MCKLPKCIKTHHFVSLCLRSFSNFGTKTCACSQIHIVNIVHPSHKLWSCELRIEVNYSYLIFYRRYYHIECCHWIMMMMLDEGLDVDWDDSWWRAVKQDRMVLLWVAWWYSVWVWLLQLLQNTRVIVIDRLGYWLTGLTDLLIDDVKDVVCSDYLFQERNLTNTILMTDLCKNN